MRRTTVARSTAIRAIRLRPRSGEPGTPGSPTRRVTLTGASGVVPLARDFTRQALHDWGWLPAGTADRRASAEDVLLVVSELVTNACLHGGGPDELRLHRAPKVLRLEVSDGGSGAPRAAHPAPRRAPRRPRHVHRAAALPGLGRRTPAGRPHRQDGLGGTGVAGVRRPPRPAHPNP